MSLQNRKTYGSDLREQESRRKVQHGLVKTRFVNRCAVAFAHIGINELIMAKLLCNDATVTILGGS